jgi:signal transduction histidine kinase
LVNQLQDSVRAESGAINLDVRVVDGAALLQEAVEAVELEARGRGLRLRWRSPIGDSLHIIADPKAVGQILANLLSNAIKFTPGNGLIDVQAQRDGEQVRFSVIDTGPGISADKLPNVFERFYQGGDKRARREGLGLGLSICKGLVEAHQGRIWVESTPGAGAVFHFTLPSAKMTALEPE